MKHNKSYKCVLIGNKNIGKTSFLMSLKTKSPPEEYVPTIYEDCQIEINDESNTYLNFVDTCSCESYDKTQNIIYANADLFLLCFSIINQKSFDDITKCWYPDIKEKNKHVPIILVGMKSDFRDQTIDKNKNQGNMNNLNLIPLSKCYELNQKIKSFKYIECSSFSHESQQEFLTHCYSAIKNQPKTICIIM